MDIARHHAGQRHTSWVDVSAEQVHAFAEATGDRNPIHLDAAYAATTRFGRPIAHGMLLLGLVSRVLGTEFPGPGTIYVTQSARFHRPVHVGSRVQVVLSVEGVDEAKRRVHLTTQVLDESGQDCVSGKAEVYLPA